jgi:glycosyltransferase involved in cell wall biosynthesis
MSMLQSADERPRLRRVFVVGMGEPSQEALFEALREFCEVSYIHPSLTLAGWLPRVRRRRGDPCVLPRGAFSHRRWLSRLLAPLVGRRLLAAYGRADALIVMDPYLWPYVLCCKQLAPVLAYGISDDVAAYPHVRLEQEAFLARHADLLFPVSQRLADLLQHRYGLDFGRFHIIPNGIPCSWLPPALSERPAPLPQALPDDFRPLIGIIGVIGSRIDLLPVLAAHDALPRLRWLFVGPVRKSLPGLAQLQSSPRCRFLGALPYDDLQPYFASLDAAVLPLTDDDINPCSSPVRFFSQLPTGQPIVYTGTCAQIGEVPDLARHCGDARELIDTLQQLLDQDFDDGFGERRHAFARGCTWQQRAAVMARALVAAMPTGSGSTQASRWPVP